jgi:protein arginine kinase activator
MKCEKCKDQDATIHFTQVRDGKVVSYNLCQECAGDAGMKGAKFDSSQQPMFAPEAKKEVLSELAHEAGAVGDGHCPFCNSTLDDIKNSGRLGCSQCYFTFENQVDVLLRRIQGSSFHVGKRISRPEGKVYDNQMLVRELKKKLSESVKKEEYEKAAEIRDEIRKLEKRMEVS